MPHAAVLGDRLRGQSLGELVATAGPEGLVFGGIGAFCLGQDLVGQLTAGPVRQRRGVGLHFRAVDGDDPGGDQTLLDAQSEHLGEQVGDGFLMAATEPGERGVVGVLICRHHPEGDVVTKPLLNAPRGAFPHAIGVEKDPEQHGGVIGGSTPTVFPVGRVELGQVQLSHDIDNEPGQVVFGQPVRDRGRHQELLATVRRTHIYRHSS